MLSSAAPDDDFWFALDKLEHFILCALTCVLAYWVCTRVERLKPYRISLSFSTGIIVGLAKELGDFLQVGSNQEGFKRAVRAQRLDTRKVLTPHGVAWAMR